MPHYIVINADVINPEMYGQYAQGAVPTLMQYGVKVLVADREPKDIEGKSGHNLAILEFESEAAAMRWYNSPEYQAVIQLRLNSTDGWLRIAPQFVMPGA